MQFVRIFLALILTAYTLSGAPQISRTISGRLIFENVSISCGDVEVQLVTPGMQAVSTTSADSSCSFSFPSIPPGTYYVHVQVQGFKEVYQRLDLVNGLGGANVVIPISAKNRGSAPPEGSAKTVDKSEFLEQYPAEAVSLFKKALENHKKGKSQEAIKQLQDALHIAPNFYHAHSELGVAFLKMGNFSEAETHLTRARELNRTSADPLIYLSELYRASDQPEKAVELSQEALKNNSLSAPAHLSLGLAFYTMSNFDRAEEALNRALELSPKMPQARLALANVYMKSQQYDKLLEQLNDYVAENPKSPERAQAEEIRDQILKAKDVGQQN